MMSGATMTLCLSHAPGFARDKDEEYGLEFRQGLREVTNKVSAFDPTLVVVFGSDHRKAFTDVVPGISVVLGAEGMGDLLSPTGPYDVPKELARELATFLIDQGLDVAVTRHVALDHGFGQMFGEVLGALDAVPAIPIFINCATLPLAAPGRSVELGEAVGRFFERVTDERILFLASGGLSHSPPSLALTGEPTTEAEAAALSAAHREAAMDLIRPDWDKEFLANLGSTDTSWASAITQTDIDPAGIGANEVRTWLAAYVAGRRPLPHTTYESVRMWVTGMGIAHSEVTPRDTPAVAS